MYRMAYPLAIVLTLLCAGCAGPRYQQGELIVIYHPDATPAQRDSLNAAHGLHLLQRIPGAGVPIDHVQIPEGAKLDRVLEAVNACSALVDTAEHNLLLRTETRITHEDARHPQLAELLTYTPNDSLYSRQWSLPRIGTPGAWDATLADSAEVVIGIIDSGIDLAHPDLAGQLWANSAELLGRPGVDDDGNGYVDDTVGWDFAAGFIGDNNPSDTPNGSARGHGTHVAGIVGAAVNNQIGTAGIALRPRLMVLKVFSDYSSGGTVTQFAKALLYAVRNGAHVVNCSLTLAGKSATVEAAIRQAESAGVLVVCSAGNNGKNLDTNPSYPASHEMGNILSVAATERNDALAGFSNYGVASVDLAAPGRDILSTRLGGGTEARTGTSQAAPIVSGAAGLVYAHLLARGHVRDPQTAQIVKATLMISADKLPAYAGKIASGRIDLDRTLNSLGPLP